MPLDDDVMCHDAAWFDLQYDNRRRVPEYAQHFARWREASAEALAGLQGHLDIPFTPDGSVSLDYFPAPRADAPVLVFIHGGIGVRSTRPTIRSWPRPSSPQARPWLCRTTRCARR